MSWNKEKRIVLEAALRLAQQGLVVGTMGNVSLRIPADNDEQLIAITPSSRYYDMLTAEDIVILDQKGDVKEGGLKPSTEKMFHIGIYKVRSDIKAIIHCHSIFSSVFAVTHQAIPPILDDQVACLGGEIRVADYAASGSKELDDNVIKALGDRNAAILANHGVVCVGKDMRDAFTNCELLEKTAEVYVHALAAGKVVILSDEAVKSGRDYYERIYRIN